MNLLVVSDFPSGRHPLAAVWFRDTLVHVRTLGHAVTVLSPRVWVPPLLGYHPRFARYRKATYFEEHAGLPVYRPAFPRPPGMWYTLWEGRAMSTASRGLVLRLHRQSPFDAVLGYCVIPFGDCAVRLGRLLRRPAACVAIGSDLHLTAQFSRSHRRLTRRIFEGATRVLTNSDELGRVALGLGARPERLRTFYKGIDLAPYEALPAPTEARARLRLPSDGKLLMYTGRLLRAKGLYELLEAFKEAWAAHPAWRLVLVGDPIERDKLNGYAIKLGIDAGVCMRDTVPRSEVPTYLAAGDMYVLPSHHEGVSNAALEAMAAGLPVVSTAVGGQPEVVTDGVNGRLVPPRDAGALAKVLSELMSDAEQAARLGRAARETVFERFDASRNAARLAALIEEMCAAPALEPVS